MQQYKPHVQLELEKQVNIYYKEIVKNMPRR